MPGSDLYDTERLILSMLGFIIAGVLWRVGLCRVAVVLALLCGGILFANIIRVMLRKRQ